MEVHKIYINIFNINDEGQNRTEIIHSPIKANNKKHLKQPHHDY